MRPIRNNGAKLVGLLVLTGGALYLYGAAGYWRWLMLAGYLLTVAAWWAIVRPPLTTRRIRWQWRRRRH